MPTMNVSCAASTMLPTGVASVHVKPMGAEPLHDEYAPKPQFDGVLTGFGVTRVVDATLASRQPDGRAVADGDGVCVGDADRVDVAVGVADALAVWDAVTVPVGVVGQRRRRGRRERGRE